MDPNQAWWRTTFGLVWSFKGSGGGFMIYHEQTTEAEPNGKKEDKELDS